MRRSMELAIADFHDLLVKTSRTFALSIPVLEGPARREVTIAYLLFRIADILEDASSWPASRRVEALETFARLVRSPGAAATAAATAAWLAERPSEHPGYLELLAAAPEVLAAARALNPVSREVLEDHTVRTCLGMARFVAAADGRGHFELRDAAALRRYCYAVAGIVGELLTELFLIHDPGLRRVESFLRRRAASFGEGLQLVNILKDSSGDAAEGRRFVPAGVGRGRIFSLARRDLCRADEYVRELQRCDSQRGIVVFTALPVLLARATLAAVETSGPGAMVERERVLEIAQALHRRLEAGEAAL